MNGKSVILLLVAGGCGLAAMFGTRQMLARDRGTPKYREVLIAARDLKVEEVLKPDMVQVTKIAEMNIPAGSFQQYKDIGDRWVRVPMLAGDPILEAKLAPKNAPLGLLARIPDGMRAFAIEVNEQSGVSGFVLPDHRVDVVLSRNRQNESEWEPAAETILEDVMVLAAGSATTRPEDKTIEVRTVTLALTPSQVDTLVAAKTEGSLTLALRGVNDHKTVSEPKRKPRELAENLAVLKGPVFPGVKAASTSPSLALSLLGALVGSKPKAADAPGAGLPASPPPAPAVAVAAPGPKAVLVFRGSRPVERVIPGLAGSGSGLTGLAAMEPAFGSGGGPFASSALGDEGAVPIGAARARGLGAGAIPDSPSSSETTSRSFIPNVASFPPPGS